MVKIALKIAITSQNIESLKTSGNEFRWYLKFICCNCGEISEKWNYVSLNQSTPVQKGNAVTHFASKCKLCARENSMTILKDHVKPFFEDNKDKFQTIAIFDCRALEPNDFSAREGWIVKTIDNGTEFTDVDLSEGEWADYCDKIKCPVAIYKIEHKFERVK
ncbi:CXXC motif containing zinc binding protein [Ptiloglossa arizonensis]|uniref:CXXC motif containing zinc binding protein n=1 Tax=Ptiloglossa arizonensis TaxID=3350558 RepID=UPI003F9F2715